MAKNNGNPQQPQYKEGDVIQTGCDPKNGIVEMVKTDKGCKVKNSRTGYNKFFLDEKVEDAKAAFEEQVNNSQN